VATVQTRERILACSLLLFNERGENNVTTNAIADETDISPGNLYYHFRSKNDIVIELFKRFITQLKPLLEVPGEALLEAEDLWFQLHLMYELKGRFRFFYRNLTDLTERVPALHRAFRGLLSKEKEAISSVLDGLEKKGSLQASARDREVLADNLLLATNYWIPFNDIVDHQSMANGTAQTKAVARALQLILPYLREPEQQSFHALIDEYLD
jgi:AcrR family transcriptional regulator